MDGPRKTHAIPATAEPDLLLRIATGDSGVTGSLAGDRHVSPIVRLASTRDVWRGGQPRVVFRSPKIPPWGSVTMEKRPPGKSMGASICVPPAATAFVVAASTSSTAK